MGEEKHKEKGKENKKFPAHFVIWPFLQQTCVNFLEFAFAEEGKGRETERVAKGVISSQIMSSG